MLRIALPVCLAAALAVLRVPAPAASIRRADLSFSSRALGGRLHYEVFLPAGYATSGSRFPVVYFLHGLPAAPTSYRSLGFVERALAREGKPAILVVPQGARADERDPEYVNHGPGDDWGTAIAQELPRAVDTRFRTIARRAGRAIIGLSAGGFGAMHLALAHLREFAVVESWSGYFHPTNPAGTRSLDLGSPAKNARADVHRQLAAERTRLRSEHLFIAFYSGRSDRRFRRENVRLDRELRQAHVTHIFRLYRGGHTQRLWQEHAGRWLGLALVHLAAAR
jgi:enterochelin esterase-like enzyme